VRLLVKRNRGKVGGIKRSKEKLRRLILGGSFLGIGKREKKREIRGKENDPILEQDGCKALGGGKKRRPANFRGREKARRLKLKKNWRDWGQRLTVQSAKPQNSAKYNIWWTLIKKMHSLIK